MRSAKRTARSDRACLVTKILLIGATSSLAHALLPRLAEFADVVTAGRTGCDVQLDFRGDINIPRGFDAVVNTAAHLGGDDATSMIEAELVNAVGMIKLCKASTEARVGHLVHVSSGFAELPSTSPSFGIYALSKRHADEVANLYSTRYSLPLAIVRPSRLYGAGETYRRNQPFLYTLMDKAEANEDIVIYGANDAQRNFIHVEDVANVLALTVQRRLLGSFSCAYPENLRYSLIARAAIEAFVSGSSVRFAETERDIPDDVFQLDGALFRLLGYAPRISMEDGMRMEANHRRAR